MSSAVREEAGEVRREDAFDVAALHAWLAARVPDLAADGPPEVRQFGGGVSNLTYLLRYGGRDLIMRRPPRGHKAASAHDMRREFTVQQRLRPHFGAVPEMVAFCDDPAVLGGDFYVMERVAGTILRRELPPGVVLDEARTRALGHTVVDTLADLHAVDPAGAGLGDLGRGPGYVRRQVEGWSRRYRGALTDDVPDGEDVMAWLDGHRPEDAATRLIHNDWKLDNLVLDLDGPPRVVGVLDWEMATVGDPLMELGSAMAYWITADDDEMYAVLRNQPTHLPGMPTREEFVERYLDRTGLRMERWEFYEVFGLFRLAVIAQQIWFRYRAGQTTNPAFASFGGAVRILLDRASSLARRPY
ncbi:phosphotransferase family protein [Planomonospora venezuelensis]|uniref:Aminoglycoside phosphotransferase (APT) family kinase protein n=1 Tax=Planomonospora venezuelensis TaxID=1999 RepID=A0A841D071_PLAVE|nr:phosphotransferase family protein [Planomonospora venezuelensis]MBB5963641.1 aminoglycoside phosphotransferase (APT) family kinase protein [Planomonospora venezuelensis]